MAAAVFDLVFAVRRFDVVGAVEAVGKMNLGLNALVVGFDAGGAIGPSHLDPGFVSIGRVSSRNGGQPKADQDCPRGKGPAASRVHPFYSSGSRPLRWARNVSIRGDGPGDEIDEGWLAARAPVPKEVVARLTQVS